MAIVAPDPGPDLAAAVTAAHERVRRLATDGMPVPLRPGTTLTAALVTGRRLRLAHLGDSSCWLLRRGRLRRLTEEHTHAAAARRGRRGAARLGGAAPAGRHADPLRRHARLGLPAARHRTVAGRATGCSSRPTG